MGQMRSFGGSKVRKTQVEKVMCRSKKGSQPVETLLKKRARSGGGICRVKNGK